MKQILAVLKVSQPKKYKVGGPIRTGRDVGYDVGAKIVMDRQSKKSVRQMKRTTVSGRRKLITKE